MEVGILIRGTSLVKPIEGIELKRCITFKQLAKYEIRILENVRKDDFENVKQLPSSGSTYCIGACDETIQGITVPIASLEQILNKKDAVLKEKEKRLKELKRTTEQKAQLQQELGKSNQTLSDLREKIKDLNIINDKNNKELQEKEREIKALQDKLSAESGLRQKYENDLRNQKLALGEALEKSQSDLDTQKNDIETQYNNEIGKIEQALKAKDDIIKTKDDEITELKRVNSELGKAGVIPDITYTYNGKAQIIGVCGHGSYGISSLVYTIYKILAEQKNVLIVDLDFKGGNIGKKYLNSDNKSIENILNQGPLLREKIIKTMSGKIVNYIGGVNRQWTPYQILNLPWEEIFKGDYDFILCDCGTGYGGYNIQTKICEFIGRIGKIVYLYRDEIDHSIEIANYIPIKNFSNNNLDGIPYITELISENKSLYDNPITRQLVHEKVVNKIIK